MNASISLTAPENFPLVEPGDDIAQLIKISLTENGIDLAAGDVLVVAQKIISKAEGRYVSLADVTPGGEAQELARKTDKDPRIVELILSESNQVVRQKPGVLVVEHRLGYVHANAGMDQSNLPDQQDDPKILLLPEDPDASAAKIRDAVQSGANAPIAVIINDSVGRAWRMGVTSMAIGCAGICPVSNQIGEKDIYGRPLEVTEIAIADELASAASLIMGEGAQARPLVHIRGAKWEQSDGGSQALIRPREMDMFR